MGLLYLTISIIKIIRNKQNYLASKINITISK
jgi:hypothetical protein